MWKPCIDCGTPAPGTRCPQHQQQLEARLQTAQTRRRQTKGGRSKYGGAYQQGAARVRADATHCWLCGGTADPTDPWQADHLLQGGRNGHDSPLAPAHRSCNIRRRHLTAQGHTHQQIVERLKQLRHGPAHADPPHPQGATPQPPQQTPQTHAK